MATKNGSVTLRGAFPAGTKVGLYERRGDFFAPGDKPVKTATADKKADVTFTGLEVGAPFFAAADVDDAVRVRSVTAKGEEARPEGVVTGNVTNSSINDPGHSVNAKSNTADRQKVSGPQASIVTGPRGTKASESRGHAPPPAPFSNPIAGQPLSEKGAQQAAAARMVGSGLVHGNEIAASDGKLVGDGSRIEDAPENLALASDTFTGQVEPAPTTGLKQSDVPKGTPQLSDTPYGEASIIPQGIPEKQEDSDGLQQLSDTPEGTTAPVPPARQEVAETIEPEAGVGPGEPSEAPLIEQDQEGVERKGSTDKLTATRQVAGRQSSAGPSSSLDITPVGRSEVKKPKGGKPVATASSGQKASKQNTGLDEGPKPKRSRSGRSSKSTKSSRSAAAKKAARTRKANQKKKGR